MDFQKVCRLCLRIPRRPIKLCENKFFKKIEAISSIMIKSITELPDQICEECSKLLDISYKFRLVIINSDNDLNSRLVTLKETNYLTKRRTTECTTISPSSIKTESNTHSRVSIRPKKTIKSNQTNRSHTKSRTYQCDLCKKVYNTGNAYWKHKESAHNTRYVLCNFCGRKLLYRNVKKHIIAKHKGEPVHCDICGKLCIHTEALKVHKKENHAPKEFSCQFCGKTFCRMCRLKAHLGYHTKENKRPRVCCSICGKVVTSLRRHMLSHTGERPHICIYCNKGMSSAYALKVHTRSHTNERPYTCTYCDAAYTQTVSLRTHLRSKHGIT